MIFQRYKKLVPIFLAFVFIFSTESHAQNSIFSGDVTAEAKVVSDYRFRGVSKTNNDFAVQGSLDFFLDSGLYTGIWASNVSDFRGSDVESNLYLGYNTENNGIIYDVGLTAYVYPGGTNANYVEAYGSVGLDFGLLTSSVGLSYMPSQSNNGDQDNVYFFGEIRGDIPDTPFSVNFNIGYEDGVFGNSKWDWKLGTSVAFEQFELGVAYVDTNQPGQRSDSGVIFSIAAFF